MTLPVSSIGSIQPLTGSSGAAPAAGKPGQFASMLDNAIQGIEKPGNEATQAIQNLLAGGNEELHKVAVATTKADLTFELGLQVRNKIIQAYQTISQMQF